MDDWTARERVLVALLGVAVFAIMCLAAALANVCSSELRDAVRPVPPPRPASPTCDPDEPLVLRKLESIV